MPPLIVTHAITAGTRPGEGGASASRVMATPEGEFHVKFVGLGGEARHGPMNELLGNRLLTHLGINRPRLAIIRIPRAIRKDDAELGTAGSEYGLGIERISGAADLNGSAAIDTAARSAPEFEVCGQFVVLTWLQNTDHGGHNYLLVGTRVVAIDFAASPQDGVWDGASLGEERHGHDLRSAVDRMADDVWSDVLDRVEAIDHSLVASWLEDSPDEWASATSRNHIAAELMRTKGRLLADFRRS